jgi:DNA-binding transcriptional MerR regulator
MDATRHVNVTTGEAARALDVTHSTLLRWMRAGIVRPASRTAGGHWRWDVQDLRRQLADHHRDMTHPAS